MAPLSIPTNSTSSARSEFGDMTQMKKVHLGVQDYWPVTKAKQRLFWWREACVYG